MFGLVRHMVRPIGYLLSGTNIHFSSQDALFIPASSRIFICSTMAWVCVLIGEHVRDIRVELKLL